MTVESTKWEKAYVGTGLLTDYPYDFLIYLPTHLEVIERDTDEVETTLSYPGDYTVTGHTDPDGGLVKLSSVLALDHKLLIRRLVPVLQETDLRNQGTFFPETHEKRFDLIVMMLQRLSGALGNHDPDLSRCLMLGVNDVIGSGQYRGQGNRISFLGDPVDGQDAVTLSYLASFAGGGGIGRMVYLTTLPTLPADGPTWDGVPFIYKPDTDTDAEVLMVAKDRAETGYVFLSLGQARPF